MNAVALARQPIYDRQLRVYAYELLYRSDTSNQANFTDGDQATSEVIVNAVMEIGLEHIVGHRPAFINMTHGFLTGALPLPLLKETVVLEVLEDVSVDVELIAGLEHLADSGYLIALDDFTYRPDLNRLLEIAHIVKLDVLALEPDDLSAHVDLLRDYNVKLVAEKVETQDELARCQELGFDYFQGYFFCQPDLIAARRLGGNRLVIVKLVAKLQDPAVDVGELEILIAQDASLAYRLLRYINSAFFSLRSKVTSIQHALFLLGPKTIKKWASLLLMVRLGDEKPHELIVTGMVRGKMCEIIGIVDAHSTPDQYFTVGLFSILDALMDMSLPKVLEELPLAEDTNQALMNRSGSMGEVLRDVLDYEKGTQGTLNGADFDTYQHAYLDSIKWADDACSAIYH